MSYDQLLTNRLILQPEAEINLYSQDDPARRVGSGLSDLDAGLRLRYEIIRKVAPYLGVTWERKFGETADLARAAGEQTSDVRLTIGIPLMVLSPLTLAAPAWRDPGSGSARPCEQINRVSPADDPRARRRSEWEPRMNGRSSRDLRRHFPSWPFVALAGLAIGVVLSFFIYFGVYDIGADSRIHPRFTG